jgi:hypothetical protein
MKTILPFYAALIAALLFVTYVPAFRCCCPGCGSAIRDEMNRKAGCEAVSWHDA